MLAHLLLSAVIALLVVIAWQLRRRRSTQTQVAGDQVTLQALKADITETNANVAALEARMAQISAELAEVRRYQAGLRDIGDQTAREMNIITQALETHFTADRQRNEQEWPASVCSTGGHRIIRRIHS